MARPGLPERFGNWKSARRRWSRWAAGGVWEKASQHLAGDAGNECAMIDSTIVRARQHSAGAQKKSEETATVMATIKPLVAAKEG